MSTFLNLLEKSYLLKSIASKFMLIEIFLANLFTVLLLKNASKNFSKLFSHSIVVI